VVSAKILSLVSVQCKRDNFAIPLLGGQAKTSKLKARSSWNPKPAYMEDPIVVLDFHLCTHLPSSRRTCPMTPCAPLAKKDDVWSRLWETNDVTFDEENEYGVKVPKTVRFVKTEKLGVLPASYSTF
jgi:hypothetical protein